MARTPVIAANWKMHKTIAESEAFARRLASEADSFSGLELLIFPTFLSLPAVAAQLRSSAVKCGAQDLYWGESGAFTGEVSAGMIRDAGGSCAIIGHSERRHVLGEDDGVVARKLRAALDGGLHAVLCVGETIEERESGVAETRVTAQLEAALSGLDSPRGIIIAYEPVWAIGTGRTATPADAQAMHALVRKALADRFGDQGGERTRILYGGSVKPDNAEGLASQPDVDGALVGGASLDVDSFLAIARAAT